MTSIRLPAIFLIALASSATQAQEQPATPPASTALPEPLRAVIHFEEDRSNIRKEEEPALGRIAAYLKQHPGLKVEVQGHTDPFGTVEYKQALGERYAHAVASWLTEHGVPATQLQTISYGKERPAYKGTDQKKALRNARVTFHPLGP